MKDQSLRVLMIEDSEDDALLLIRELKKGGYNPVYERVETAAAMKKSLKEQQWDIILCDYNLTTFNAPSAVAVLKEANIDIPIIILSGMMGEEEAIEYLRLGAQDFIMKGNLSRLCPAIARELEDAKVRNKQKHTEETLRAEEQRFRAVAEQSSDLIILINREGHITYENPAVEKYLGFRAEARVGASIFDHVHPDDLKLIADASKTLWRSIAAPVQRSEIRICDKNGNWRTFEFVESKLERDNVIESVIINLRDITERKQAEKSLKEAELKFRTIFNSASDGILIAQPGDRKFSITNEKMCVMLGYTKEELLQMGVADIHPEESVPYVIDQFEKLLRKEILIAQDIPFMRKDKTVFFADVGASQITLDGKKCIIGMFRDVTERKRAEDMLRDREQQISLIVNNIASRVSRLDRNFRYIFVNREFERVYHIPPEKMLGHTIAEVFGDELFQSWLPYARRALDGELVTFESQAKNQAGETVHGLSKFIADFSPEGTVRGLFFVTIDITELKQAEEKLERTLESLRKAFDATVQVMVSAIEASDPYTAGHQVRSAALASAITLEMGLPQEKIDAIRMAGSIHDIGKMSIPSQILTKPTRLTNVEFSLIKEHPHSGYEMLKDVESPWPLAQIVYQHHERMNGSGYPRNLKGDEILMEARIMAVADVVESMASHRPYRPALGIGAALEEIEKNKGTLYDSAVADACLRLFRGKGYQLEGA